MDTGLCHHGTSSSEAKGCCANRESGSGSRILIRLFLYYFYWNLFNNLPFIFVVLIILIFLGTKGMGKIGGIKLGQNRQNYCCKIVDKICFPSNFKSIYGNGLIHQSHLLCQMLFLSLIEWHVRILILCP